MIFFAGSDLLVAGARAASQFQPPISGGEVHQVFEEPETVTVQEKQVLLKSQDDSGEANESSSQDQAPTESLGLEPIGEGTTIQPTDTDTGGQDQELSLPADSVNPIDEGGSQGSEASQQESTSTEAEQSHQANAPPAGGGSSEQTDSGSTPVAGALTNAAIAERLRQAFGTTNIDLIVKAYQRVHNLPDLPSESVVLDDLLARISDTSKNFDGYVNKLRGHMFEEHVAAEMGIILDADPNKAKVDGVLTRNGKPFKVQIKSGPSQVDTHSKIVGILDDLDDPKGFLVVDADGFQAIANNKRLYERLLSEGLLKVDDTGQIVSSSRIQVSSTFSASQADEFIKAVSQQGTKIKSVVPGAVGSVFGNTADDAARAIANSSTISTINGKLSQFWNIVKGTKLGSMVSNVGNKFASTLSSLATKFPKIAGLLGKLGGVLGLVGAVAGAFQAGNGAMEIYELFKSGGLMSTDGIAAVSTTLAGLLYVVSGFLGTVGLVPGAQAALPIAAILGVAGLALDGVAWTARNWQKVKDAAIWVKDKVVEGAVYLKDKAVEAAKSVAETAKNTAIVAWEGLKSAVKFGAETYEVAKQKMVDFYYKHKEALGKSLQEFHMEYIAPALAATGMFVKKIIKTPRKVYETVKKTVMKAVNYVAEPAKKVYQTATRWVNKAVDVVKRIPRIVYDRVKTYVTDKVRQAYTVTKTVYDTVRKSVREAYTVVKSVPRRVTEYVSKQVRKAYTYYERVRKTGYKWVREQYSYWTDVKKTESYYVQQTSWKKETVWYKRWWGWFKDTVWKKVTSWVKKYRTYWTRVKQWAYRNVQKAYNYFVDVARTGYRWVTERVPVVKTVYDRVKQTAYRWVDKTYQVARQVRETAYRYVNKTREVIKSVPRTVYDTVVERVVKPVQETYQVVKTIPAKIAQKLVPQEVEEVVESTVYDEKEVWVRQ